MPSEKRIVMHTRRQAFMLAGALTATVFTAVAAVAGVSHRPAASTPPAPTPIVQVAPQQAPTPRWADD
jgi:poly(3-hydroxybutyrate) depolymerase